MIRKPLLKLLFGGGLDENQMPQIGEAAKGSFNFELQAHSDCLRPRPPFDLLGTATNEEDITGFCQLVKKNASNTTLVTAGDTVYLWDGNTFTSKGTVTAPALLRDVYWSLDDYILMTDISLGNVLKKWDGTTLSNAPTGLGASLAAKYGVTWGGRVWLFNLKNGATLVPHMICASEFENPAVYDQTQRAFTGTFTTGLEAFFMFTPDLAPINSVQLFQNQLVISTANGRLFKLVGSGPEDYQWVDFYDGSAAIGDESMTTVGNDVMYMRNGGNITTLGTVQAFGDVKADDLTRWLPSTIQGLVGCIACYDQVNQKVYFFLNNGKVLVFFKDLYYSVPGESAINTNALSPWSLYKTNHPSNFSTSAAKFMYIPGTTTYAVFFGDADGNIFVMNGTSEGDANSYPISLKRITTLIDDRVMDPYPYGTKVLHGDVQYRRQSPEWDFSVAFNWSDEYNQSLSTITIKGPPSGDVGAYYNADNAYWNGILYYRQGFSFANVISHQTFSPSGKSDSGFTVEVSSTTTSQGQVDEVNFY